MRSSCLLLVTLVANLTGHAAAQEPPRWSLEPLYRVGEATGASDETSFHNVPEEGLAGRSSGSGLVVLDAGNYRILEFDSLGRHTARYGREGDGPGEFRFPLSLDVGPDGSLWAYDARTGRFTIFHRGEVRTAPAPARLFGRLRIGAGGTVYQALAQPVTPVGSSGPGSLDDVLQVARVDTATGTATPVWEGSRTPRRLLSLTEGSRVVQTRARMEFAPETFWDVLSDGTVVSSDTSAYLVKLTSGQGPVAEIGPGEDGRSVTRADRERRREELREELLAEQESRRPALRKSRRLIDEQVVQTPFVPRMPRIGGLLVDDEDRIWIGVLTTDRAQLDRIDIWSRDGSLVVTIPDPPGFPHALYGRRAAFLSEDELGVQRVHVFRVQGPRSRLR